MTLKTGDKITVKVINGLISSGTVEEIGKTKNKGQPIVNYISEDGSSLWCYLPDIQTINGQPAQFFWSE